MHARFHRAFIAHAGAYILIQDGNARLRPICRFRQASNVVSMNDPLKEKNMPEAADSVSVAKRAYDAYIAKDRAAIEALIADDFHFTSPRDNRLDRATYMSRCWPGSQMMDRIAFVRIAADGDHVFVTYDLRMNNGKSFRNTELLTVRDGKLVEAQVFFGWTLPHEAPLGGFI
jgi:ketosteroid isomerase-like protein